MCGSRIWMSRLFKLSARSLTQQDTCQAVVNTSDTNSDNDALMHVITVKTFYA
jgi:hypothetical protein